MSNEKMKFGTREWSDKSENTHVGCRHDCLYCYAKNDEHIWKIYEHLKNEKKIRWKESCKRILGLPGEEIG